MLIFRPQFQSELTLGEGPKALARRGSIAQDRVSDVIVHGDPLLPVSCLLDLGFGQGETHLPNSSLFKLLKKSIRDPCTIGGRVDDDDNRARGEQPPIGIPKSLLQPSGPCRQRKPRHQPNRILAEPVRVLFGRKDEDRGVSTGKKLVYVEQREWSPPREPIPQNRLKFVFPRGDGKPDCIPLIVS